ncbi:MAG: hypothetical protein ABFR63_08365 [Thermodesulfobacteriota bacterium]
MSSNRPFCNGFCGSCEGFHGLDQGPALTAARELMHSLARERHIALDQPGNLVPDELRTDSLYGAARGKMFGVLVCRTEEGRQQTLKGFSGQFNGLWEVEGWVPPLFDVKTFQHLNSPVEKQIKGLGRRLEETGGDRRLHSAIRQERRDLSRGLMREIHALYRVHNFKGETCSLFDLFGENNGIPTGTGDCCGPKLLNHAARQGLQPLGLAEFYWGRTNKSNSRHEGRFYPACKEKCGPILGFMLCGIDNNHPEQ